MPVVKSKPTSPGRRFVVKVVHPDLHKGAPYKGLIETKAKSAPVTLVVATNRSIESLISGGTTKTA
jgi:ribosomal protein L2